MVNRISPSDVDTNDALRVGLKGLAQRQRVIANNIANADTPNFKAGEVRFEDQLATALQRRGGLALQRTDAAHLALGPQSVAAVQPTERTIDSLSYRTDGNNVDIDAQMSALAETQLRFSALTQAAGSRLGQLRTIVTEGRR